MENYNWDLKTEYLMSSRYNYFNDDYWEFLVKKVWKMNYPLKILDFGCGLGYLGLKILPNLPNGSTYTGVDMSEKLISEANDIFKTLPYESRFFQGNIMEWDSKIEFDVVICQTLMIHLPNPKEALKRMYSFVKPGGKVICIEPHYNSALLAGFYIDEIEYSQITNLGILQKLYENDRKKNKNDGFIGNRLPMMMSEIGLRDVECRVSDCVRYLHPKTDPKEKEKIYNAFCTEVPILSEEERIGYIFKLMRRGLTEEEANEVFNKTRYFAEQFRNNGMEYNTLIANCFLITFGIK